MATAPLSQPPSFLGASSEAQQEYFNALNKALAALENRQGINMFEVAGAFLDPGRTGSFGEALGRASTVAGKNLERDEARELPIAQMKASLAGQKYETTKQANALNMLGQVLGVPGSGAISALSSQNPYDPSLMQRLVSIYPAVAQDPKTGLIVKEMISQQVEMQKLLTEERKLGVTEAEQYDKRGPAILPLLSPEFQRRVRGGPAPSGTPAPTAYATAPTTAPVVQPPGTVPVGTPTGKTPEDAEDQRARGETPPAATTTTTTAPTTSTPIAEIREDGYTLPTGEFVKYPPGASNELKRTLTEAAAKAQLESAGKSATEQNTYWNKQRQVVYDAGSPTIIARQRTDLDIVRNAADKYPQIFGQLAKQGLMTALGASLEKGAQAGQFGSFSLPVEEFVSKLNQNDPDLAVKANVAKAMARIFFDNTLTARTVLGRFTDQDARLAQAPLASMSDPAKAVLHWAGEQTLGLHQKEQLYQALHSFDRTNKGADPKAFFDPEVSPVYRRVLKEYEERMAKWLQTSPLYRR